MMKVGTVPPVATPAPRSVTRTSASGGFCRRVQNILSLKNSKGELSNGRVTAFSLMLILASCFIAYHLLQSNVCLTQTERHLDPEKYASERIRFRGTNRRLPQCIIAGVRKCGTRALLEFLNLHPRIQAAHGEVHFFDEDENYMKGLEWYRKRMPYSFPDQITIEKSPAYFIVDTVPGRIQSMNSSIKLLFVVREPITRAISDYTQIHSNKLNRGKPHDSFEELAVKNGKVDTSYKAIRIGLYYRFFARWLEYFSLEQIHVVDGDQLIENPIDEIRRIEKFLNIGHFVTKDNFYYNETKGFYCIQNDTAQKCLSETKGRPHPAVAQEVLDTLGAFYRPWNKKFYQLVGRDFNW